jgi:hypothetical protein
MASKFEINGLKWKGYTDDPVNAGSEYLSTPSVNVSIDKTFVASTRLGYEPTSTDLGQAGKPARSFYVERFNVTLYSVGTKVYYEDHNNSDALVDTGLSLTTGTICRFEEYAGQVFVTNQTDGAKMILFTQLNDAAATLGDATVTLDIDGAARIDRFDTQLSPGTKYLRIAGVNEQYTSLVAATGVVTLTGTLSASAADNRIAIVVYDLSTVLPKCSKIIAWKESINCIGNSVAGASSTSDVPPSVLSFSQFATAAAIENIVKFTAGTSGTELVGKSGILTNAVAIRDYLYLFKQGETYYIKVSDVVASSGARPPQLLSSNYGCLNEDCAADMGNGEVVFLTSNNRIIRIKISLQDGAAAPYPDEGFDSAYSNTLKLMDATQTGALVFYAKTEKRLYVQVTVDGQKLTLPYNNEIKAWEPPRSGWFFYSYTERGGILYGTDMTEDTIFKLGQTLDDDGAAIECVTASGQFQFKEGKVTCSWKEVELSGSMTQNTDVTVEMIVDDGTPQVKTFDSTGVSFDQAPSLGSVTMGTTVLGNGGVGELMGGWDKRYAVFPSIGSTLQIIISSNGEGHAFSWDSFTIRGKSYSKSFFTLS